VQPSSGLGVSTTSESNRDIVIPSSGQLLEPTSSVTWEMGVSGDDSNSDYSDTYDSEIDGIDIEELMGDIIAAEGRREDQDAIRGNQDEVGELSEEEESTDKDADFCSNSLILE